MRFTFAKLTFLISKGLLHYPLQIPLHHVSAGILVQGCRRGCVGCGADGARREGHGDDGLVEFARYELGLKLLRVSEEAEDLREDEC